MRYFLFILLVSCNAKYETAETIEVPILDSSLIDSLASFNERLKAIDSSGNIEYAISEIKKLNREKKQLETQLNNEVRIITVAKKDTSKDRLIAELRTKLSKYETEITRLQKQVPEKERTFVDQVPNQIEPEKPNEKSLVIELDRRIRDGGMIPDESVDIYLIPYDRKRVKKLMVYEISCDLYQINSLNGRQAQYYNGQHFFNDVAPGKYLVKICYYYGGYSVIEKKDQYQKIEMKVSPPTQ